MFDWKTLSRRLFWILKGLIPRNDRADTAVSIRRRRRIGWCTELLEHRIAPAIITVNSSLDTNSRDSYITLREAILLSNGDLAYDSLSDNEKPFVNGVPAQGVLDSIVFAITHGDQAATGLSSVSFSWEMQERTQQLDGRIVVPNTPGYVAAEEFLVRFDGRGSLLNGAQPTGYQYQIRNMTTGEFYVGNTTSAPNYEKALRQGTYEVNLIVSAGDHFESTTQTIQVRDILIVAIGDSYSSGEGNPDVRITQGSLEWMQSSFPWESGNPESDRQHAVSHRSSYAASAQFALQLEQADPHTSVTFVFVSAAGATISKGGLDEYGGIGDVPGYDTDPPMKPQLDQVEELITLANGSKREIDYMTVSFGGNDIGFSRIVQSLILADPERFGNYFDDVRPYLEQAVLTGGTTWWDLVGQTIGLTEFEIGAPPTDPIAGLNGLAAEYQRLAERIQQLQPREVLITEYPDPTTELVDGVVTDSLEILQDVIGVPISAEFDLEADAQEIAWVRDFVIAPLRAAIMAAATTHDWTFVAGINEAFQGHGYHARLVDRWIRTAAEAEIYQGPPASTPLEIKSDTTGTLHPNEAGHAAIAERLVATALELGVIEHREYHNFVIYLTSPLPEITDAVFIDGYSQTGSQPNTNFLDQGLNTVLSIQLDGSRLQDRGRDQFGLKIVAGNSTVQGLDIRNFGIGIGLHGQRNNSLEGNFVVFNGIGIDIVDSADNRIGGIDAPARNVISGNHGYGDGNNGNGAGITMISQLSTGNRVSGNLIGTDLTGTSAVPNKGVGVLVSGLTSGAGGWASDNTIDGRNIISGNSTGGIEVSGGSGNVITGNLIGTDITGTIALPNSFEASISSSAVALSNSASNTLIADNVISGNHRNGVSLSSNASENTVRGNFIGTDITGLVAVPNGGDGVRLSGASDNEIGGSSAPDWNLIAGNSGNGIAIIESERNRVLGNLIGTNVTGAFPLGNSNGVVITQGEDNLIGGPGLAGNLISGNSGSGIVINEGATSTRVAGNRIGTDHSGTAALANGLYGVQIVNSSVNTIGGINSEDRNLIAGNANAGILMTGPSSTTNAIQGNYVGTDSTGLVAIPNLAGVLITAGAIRNTIGGTTSTAGNLVSGNREAGIFIHESDENVVSGNIIGLNLDGSRLENQFGIVLDAATGNLIGGLTNEERNVLSENVIHGISIQNGSTENQVQGNLIGLTVDGLAAAGNGQDGISIIDSSGNQIGGIDPSARNTISGNLRGISIGGVASTGNLILGNWIGVDELGLAPVPNSLGIVITEDASSNRIGGPEINAGNLISGNTEIGVAVFESDENIIEGNRIGTNLSGTNVIGNRLGIALQQSTGNLIQDNLISANTQAGVLLISSDQNTVAGNRIGTDETGQASLGNLRGIELQASDNNRMDENLISGNHTIGLLLLESSSNEMLNNKIGTDSSGESSLGNSTGVQLQGGSENLIEENLISGNQNMGLHILESASNDVRDNKIGTSFSGQTALGNGTGIQVQNSTDTLLEGNLISGNSGTGIILTGSNTTQNRLFGNRIGTSEDGIAPLGNGGHGVAITAGAHGNRIGGSESETGNLVSGNTESGIALFDVSENIIEGNRIGTNLSGTAAIGNESGLVLQRSTENLIRGNLITSNRQSGVLLIDSDQNTVTGNRIGTDEAGEARLGNARGIELQNSDNTLLEGNLISGNQTIGLHILESSFNEVRENKIGTSLDGEAVLGNATGVQVQNSTETLLAGNLVSGNSGIGIILTGSNTTQNRLSGNWIGTTLAGTSPLKNGEHGVLVTEDASGNFIGTDGDGTNDETEGNTIAFNGGKGVLIVSGTANTVRRNSIHTNGSLGIDLGGNGVTLNDLGDVDIGPNQLQNFPILTSAEVILPSFISITGILNNIAPLANYTLDFYGSAKGDSSKHGEGQTYLGSTQVTTDQFGNGIYNVTFPISEEPRIITATATDWHGNTSEFSAPPQSFTPLPSLLATLNDGHLVITDTSTTGRENRLNLRRNLSDMLVVADEVERFIVSPIGGFLTDNNRTLLVPFSDVSRITIYAAGGADTLIVDLSHGDIIPGEGLFYHGGDPSTPPGDGLEIVGGNQGTVTYAYLNRSDGSIEMSSYGRIDYTGLEPIINSGSASDVILRLPSVVNAATLGDDGTLGNGLSRLSGDTFELTDFASPTNSLTIIPGSDSDALTISALPDFTSSLILGEIDNPFKTVTLAPTISVSAGMTLSLWAGSLAGGLDLSSGGVVSLTATNGILLNGVAVGTGQLLSNPDSHGNGTGVMAFVPLSQFSVTINGTVPGQLHGQLRLVGEVDLTGVELVLDGNYVPTALDSFVLIDNDGVDAIVGTFNGLPEGTVLSVRGVSKRLSYVGGTGNDVVLLPVAQLSAGLTNGHLTITDVSATGGDNRLTIVRDGSNLVIHDQYQLFINAPVEGTLSSNRQSLTIPLNLITGNITFNAAGGSDVLIVDLSAGNPISAGQIVFHGGPLPSDEVDQLLVTGGDQGTVTYSYTTATAGSVTTSQYGTISYTGLESISNAGTSSETIVNLPSTASIVTAGDDGLSGNGLSQLSAETLTTTTFSNPTQSLSIYRGTSLDWLLFNALPDFTASLQVGTESQPLGEVEFSGPLTLDADQNLFVSATMINTRGMGEITLSGAASARLLAHNGVTLAAGLAVASGGVEIDADSDADGIGTFTIAAPAAEWWTQRTEFAPAGASANDQVGISVAISGDTVVVGAHLDDVVSVDRGSAYVFVRSGMSWVQQAFLTASDGAGGDGFGRSVAIEGDTIVIGVHQDDIGSNNDQGSVYIFTRSGTNWVQQAKLTADDGAAGDRFGGAVAISGDTILVGVSLDDVAGNNDQGSAYLFVRSGANWSQQAKLTANDGATGDSFGNSVALAGNLAVVGAYQDDVGANANQGSAYIFLREGAIWSQQTRLEANDGAANDTFGVAVATDGTEVFVGAPGNDLTVTDQGAVYVYRQNGANWTLQTTLLNTTPRANDQFGSAIGISGNQVVVGNPLHRPSVLGSTVHGSAWMYSRSTGNWTFQAYVAGTTGNLANDRFGNAVAISGDTVIVGANLEDILTNGTSASDQGSAYVFRFASAGNGGWVTTADSSVSIKAADVVLNGAINAGNSVVSISPSQSGRPIITTTSSSTPALMLIDAELDLVSAGTIELGSPTTGDITFLLPITRSVPTNIHLISGRNLEMGQGLSSGSLDSAGGAVTLTPGNAGYVAVASTTPDFNTGTDGTVTFTTGSNLNISIAGRLLGIEYSQLRVVGQVDLTGVDLLLTGSFVPASADTFMIVNNDGDESVSGIFNGLPEGTILEIYGVPKRISYVSGDGNDVSLLPVATLSAALADGHLNITELSESGRDNLLTVILDGSNLVISDANELFLSAPEGAVLSSNQRTLTIPLELITGSLSITTGAGKDRLTVDFAGGNVIPLGGLTFDGGTELTGTEDLLVVNGLSGAIIDQRFTNEHSGSIEFAGLGAIGYAHAERVSHLEDVSSLVFWLPFGGTPSTLGDNGVRGDGLSRISGSNITTTDFVSPTNALTVERGQESETLMIQGLPDFESDLTLGNALRPIGSLEFTGPVGLNGDRALTAWSRSIHATYTSAISIANTGRIQLTALEGIALEGTITTNGGNLAINADSNQDGSGVFQLSATVMDAWAKQQTISANDGALDGRFGQESLAISGDTLVVGARNMTFGARSFQGAAYVFVRNGLIWTQQAMLVASDGAAEDFFGESVAISGDTIVIGASDGDVGNMINRGSAYVFTRNDSTWTQQAKLIASDGAAEDYFGSSVAIQGDVIAVGAFLAGPVNQGAAYVFTRTGTSWSERAILLPDQPLGPTSREGFGTGIAIDGNTIAVGAGLHRAD